MRKLLLLAYRFYNIPILKQPVDLDKDAYAIKIKNMIINVVVLFSTMFSAVMGMLISLFTIYKMDIPFNNWHFLLLLIVMVGTRSYSLMKARLMYENIVVDDSFIWQCSKRKIILIYLLIWFILVSTCVGAVLLSTYLKGK